MKKNVTLKIRSMDDNCVAHIELYCGGYPEVVAAVLVELDARFQSVARLSDFGGAGALLCVNHPAPPETILFILNSIMTEYGIKKIED